MINFGKQAPMKRPGQPAELATAFVMLADPMSSYVSGATLGDWSNARAMSSRKSSALTKSSPRPLSSKRAGAGSSTS